MSSTSSEQNVNNNFIYGRTNSLEGNPYTKACQNLSSGIVNIFEPPLKEVHKQLKELEEKQQDLIQKLHTENLTISEVQHSDALQAMITKMKLYHSKLQSLKKNIKILHERSTKLRKRAIKLQQIKEKEPVEEIIVSKPSSSIIGITDSA